MFKMINKELRISKCDRRDIPDQFTSHFSDTTVFYYNKEWDSVIFVSEYEYCDFFIQIAEGYMQLPKDNRELMKQQDPDLFNRIGVSKMLIILDAVILHREKQKTEQKYRELRRILCKQSLSPVFDHMDMLKAISQYEPAEGWQQEFAFLYGYIVGKQVERSRRKKVNA